MEEEKADDEERPTVRAALAAALPAGRQLLPDCRGGRMYNNQLPLIKICRMQE